MLAICGGGEERGVHIVEFSMLQKQLGIKVLVFHCMSHMLELVVHRSISKKTDISHFQRLTGNFLQLFNVPLKQDKDRMHSA